MEDKQLTIGNVTYTFPAEHVFSFTNAGEGHPFARIRPPEAEFDLIYDSLLKHKRNWEGPTTTPVAGINDHPADSFEKYESDGVVIVCRVGQPHYNCGLSITDETVQWSVVFDRQKVSQGKSVRDAAVQLLRKYRG